MTFAIIGISCKWNGFGKSANCSSNTQSLPICSQSTIIPLNFRNARVVLEVCVYPFLIMFMHVFKQSAELMGMLIICRIRPSVYNLDGSSSHDPPNSLLYVMYVQYALTILEILKPLPSSTQSSISVESCWLHSPTFSWYVVM